MGRDGVRHLEPGRETGASLGAALAGRDGLDSVAPGEDRNGGSGVGPPHAWPAELRLTVAACIPTQTPQAVMWGPEFLLFYNQRYGKLLGKRDPGAYGRPAAQAWDAAWQTLGPLVRRALVARRPIYRESQLLRLPHYSERGRSHWDLSFAPICSEAGSVLGVLGSMADTTPMVTAEERIYDLQMQLRRSEARTLQLQQAMGSRGTIGMAIGLLMSKYGCSSQRAFAILVRWSRDSNVKLRDVAQRVVSHKDPQGVETG